MSRAGVILRNVASNWGGFAVSALVTLLLTPLIVHDLGTTRYGIWALTSSIVGYYGLLDLGFRAGVTQYLTRYLAVGDLRRASSCISSALLAFTTFAVVVCSLSVIVAWHASDWFDIPAEFAHEAFWCILIIGVSSACQYVFFPFAAIFPATQRFDIANLIGIVTRLLSAAGIFFALRAGYGLIGISAATCGANLLDYIIRWRVARRLAPQLEVAPRTASLAALREVFSFGAWNVLVSINFYAYLHLPNILIASFMRVAAVGHYALVTGLTSQINAVLAPIAQVIYPAAAALHARGDMKALQQLYHDGSRLMMLAMVTIVTIAGFYAEDFYRIWIGEQFLSGTEFPSVALLLRVLLISVVVNYITAVGGQLLTGAGHVRVVSIALICGSALSLGVGVVLMQIYGLMGVAIGAVAAAIVIDLITMPVLVQKYLGFPVSTFVRHACTRPLAVAVLQCVFVSAIHLMDRPRDWAHLVGEGFLSGALCVLAVLLVGVTAAERQRFLFQPMARAWQRLRLEYR